nr:PEGA domain-containing protein [Deltaproteobacteria bacterium]
HVDLETILQRSTPLVGVNVLTDADLRAPRTKIAPPRESAPGELEENPDRDPTPVPPPEPLAGPDDDHASASGLQLSSSSANMPRAARSDDTSPNTEDPVTRVAARPDRMGSVRPDRVPEAHEKPADYVEPERPNMPGRMPPNRALLVFAALGTVALGLGAIYVFKRGKSSVLRVDAGVKYDAPFYMFEPDAPPDTIAVAIDDAALVEPDAMVDAAAARVIDPARDAGARAKPDAAVATPPDAGTGKLTIGANPWGDIVIDGAPRGRTPKAIDVPAGKHTVEIIFSGEDPPVKKTFPIEIAAGQTLPVHADFTK